MRILILAGALVVGAAAVDVGTIKEAKRESPVIKTQPSATAAPQEWPLPPCYPCRS